MLAASDLVAIDAVLARIEERPRYATHSKEILARFEEVDRRLVAAGFPPTSPWWLATIRRWYKRATQRAVLRVGRRGGKSSSLSRLAVVEALYGHHDIPPGDTGVVAIVSTTLPEASDRLTTICAILDALGVPYKPWGDGVRGIRLVGRRVGFRIFAATVAGVSGFTGIFLFLDEVAKWKDKETGANPAGEVLKSIRPTTATQPNAREAMSSSPFGMLDAHFDAFEDGDTEDQIVERASSWEANPTLTEEATHKLERDEGAWLREYKAVPQAEVESSLLSEALVDAATRQGPDVLPYEAGRRYVAAMDPATRTNSWTLVVATQGWDGVRRVALAREWTPKPGIKLSSTAVLKDIALLLKPYGLKWVITDQHAADQLAELARLAGLSLIEQAWTQVNKKDAYEHVRHLLSEDPPMLELPPDKWVKLDLLGIRKRITRAGVTYELVEQRGRHSDYAPAVALAVDDSRWRGKEPDDDPNLSDDERQAKRKTAYLEQREKDRKRAERRGRLPASHRRP